MRKTLLMGVALLAACADADVVTRENEVTQGPPLADAVMRDALPQSPLGPGERLLVGVLDEGLAATRARVLYDDGNVWAVHAFQRAGGRWVRGTELQRGRSAPGSRPEGPRFTLGGYSGRIANITDADQWYVSGHRTAGLFTMTEYYGAALKLGWAEFFPGRVAANDTIWDVSFDQWRPFRTTSPAHEWTGTTARYFPNLAVYNQQTNSYEQHYPEYWRLRYRVTVTALQPLGAFILNSEANDSDYRAYTAFVTNTPPGASFRYLWETSLDGVVWNQAGTARQLLILSAPPSVWVRVTVSNPSTDQTSMAQPACHYGCP